MSEHTNGNLDAACPRADEDAKIPSELAELDFTDLARAIELVNSNEIGTEPLATLLRNELSRIKEQACALQLHFNQSSLELRRLRENVPVAVVRSEDEIRHLQEQDDRFVVRLVEEHESTLSELRRERDTAIQRVRELSRELSRAGISTPSRFPEPPEADESSAHATQVAADELGSDLESNAKEQKLESPGERQLREERDLAEAKLQRLLAASGAADYPSLVELCTRLVEQREARLESSAPSGTLAECADLAGATGIER